MQSPAVDGALRVLAIAPAGGPALAALRAALSEPIAAGEIAWTDPLTGPTARVPRLYNVLRSDPVPHVLHFLGPCEQREGAPVIRLLDEDGDEAWFPVEDLAWELRYPVRASFRGQIRLVVLEADEGDRASTLAAAEMLSRAEAAAVVALLSPVRPGVARTFSAALYRSLAGAGSGGDVARAVDEARRAVLAAFGASADTFHPVLHLTQPDGVIFDFGRRTLVPFAAERIAWGEASAAEDALLDMGRLHEEVAARGVDAVLGDLRAGMRLAGEKGAARLAALERALDRESHRLRSWDAARAPAFFLQQLHNRCLDLGIEEVRARAEARLEEQGWPWLRERFRSSREPLALVRTLEGHTASLPSVAVTPDGRIAVSAGSDRTLKVWDLASGRAVRTLEGHGDGVWDVAVTADGRFAVSASSDTSLKVWDLATGAAARTLRGHLDWVCGVAVTPEGRLAVSASWDRTLKVWDLATGRALLTLEGHAEGVTDVAVTPDGRLAVSASADRTLKVWDLDAGRELHTLEGHTDTVGDVALTADGRLAVSASSDGTLKVWDLGTGQALRTLEGHTDTARGVALTADGRLAVSGSSGGTLKVWDLDTGQAVRTIEEPLSAVSAVAVTADGRFAVSASEHDTLKVWDLGAGHAALPEGHAHWVKGVAATADGRFAVSASLDRTLKVWDLGAGRPVRTLGGPDDRLAHADPVLGVALTPDGSVAVSASQNDGLLAWDLGTGRAFDWCLGEAICVAVDAAGRFAVFGRNDGTVHVWELCTGEDPRALDGHTAAVTGVAVTADGRLAVSVSEDRTLKVWDVAAGQALQTLTGHDAAVSGVAVTADGRFAVSASWDTTLKVWDLGTGRAVRTLEGHAAWVMGVGVTPDGRFAVSASRDRTLKVWDLAAGRPLASLVTCGMVTCCAITPDGSTLLAGDETGAFHVLDWRQGRT